MTSPHGTSSALIWSAAFASMRSHPTHITSVCPSYATITIAICTGYRLDATGDHAGICVVAPVPDSKETWNAESLLEIVRSEIPDFPRRQEADDAMAHMNVCLTAGSWKSAEQKPVRYASEFVDLTLALQAAREAKLFERVQSEFKTAKTKIRKDQALSNQSAEKKESKRKTTSKSTTTTAVRRSKKRKAADAVAEDAETKDRKRSSPEDLADVLEWQLFSDPKLHAARQADAKEPLLVPTAYFAAMSFVYLLLNPGSFVEETVSRFVSGIESACKRLAISIAEDSYVPHPRPLLQLFGATYLAQNVRAWRPTLALVRSWVQLTVAVCKEERAFDWRGPRVELFDLFHYRPLRDESEISVSWKTAAALLARIRSFPSDEQLMSYLAVHQPAREQSGLPPLLHRHRPKIMPVEHILDRHNDPSGVTYCVAPDKLAAAVLVDSKEKEQAIPTYLDRMFVEVTGMNQRRDPKSSDERPNAPLDVDFEQRPFVQVVRKAQRRALQRMLGGPHLRENPFSSAGTTTFRYEIPRSYLAGVIGRIVVRVGNKTAFVFRMSTLLLSLMHVVLFSCLLSAANHRQLSDLAAIPQPSRGSPAQLDADTHDAAIFKAQERLIQGIRWPESLAPVPELAGQIIRWDAEIEDYRVGDRPWEEVRMLQMELPIATTDLGVCKGDAFDLALTTRARGIHAQADEMLPRLLDGLPLDEVRMAYTLLVGNMKSVIELKDMGRDGHGTKMRVFPLEPAGFNVLMLLSLLYPSALCGVPHCITRIRVPCAPVLWHLRDRLKLYLEQRQVRHMQIDDEEDAEESKESKSSGWGHYGNQNDAKRNLFDYQAAKLQEIKEEVECGKRGHFLWMEVGSGKTRIIKEFIVWLLATGRMPRKCIYCLPFETMAAIIQELEEFGFPVKRLYPLKGKPKKTDQWKAYIQDDLEIRDHTIYLVEHDHLRRMQDQLFDAAPHALIIVDEVDRAENSNTQRTNVVYQATKLAERFFLMTGTPFIGRKADLLMPYLSQLVDFPVTKDNVLVAANAMVAAPDTLQIEVRRQVVSVAWESKEQLAEFNRFALPGRDKNQSRAYDVCYDRVTHAIVHDVSQRLRSDAKWPGAVIVARHSTHQQQFRQLLLQTGAIVDDDMYVLDRQHGPIQLTPENVRSGKVRKYSVMIITIHFTYGFSAIELYSLYECPYGSKLNKRKQWLGRVRRKGQLHPFVEQFIYAIGSLEYLLETQDEARSLESAMRLYVIRNRAE